MFVGIGHVVLGFPGARSLKDRRRVLNKFKDRLRVRLSVSVAEVGGESWQTATVGIALVARDAKEAEELLDRALQAAHQLADALVVDMNRRILPWDSGWPETLSTGGSADDWDSTQEDEDWDGEDGA